MTVPVNRGDLTNGLSNVATYLGYPPERVVFIHCTIIDPDDPSVGQERRQLNSFTSRPAQMLGYMPRQPGLQSSAAVLPVSATTTRYLEEIGLLHHEHLRMVGKLPFQPVYPDASVTAQLLSVIHDDTALRESLHDKILVSSFLSSDEELLSRTTNCHLLMHPVQQLPFGSKVYLRQQAIEGKYAVPLGVEIDTPDVVTERVAALQRMFEERAIDMNNAKIWLKLDSQSSGAGSKTFDNPNELTVARTDEHLWEKSGTLRVSFTPAVIELDVSNHSGMIVKANVGVQAVIAQDGITLLGCTIQKTKEGGRYIGCETGEAFSDVFVCAEKTSIPCLQHFQRKGYRGFMNLDILVAQGVGSDEMKGYIIDPNPRFSGGTPLLSIYHYAQQQNPSIKFGFMYFNAVAIPSNVEDAFGYVLDQCGPHLNRGAKSNWKGILPLSVREPNSRGSGIATVIVLGDSSKQCWDSYTKFKEKVISRT